MMADFSKSPWGIIEQQLFDIFEQKLAEERPKLKPPSRFGYVRPRVCATCKYLVSDGGGSAECLRPQGQRFELREMNQWTSVCDRWGE